MAENFNVEDFINVESPIKEKEVKLKRFKTPFKIKSLTEKELEDLRKDSQTIELNRSTRTKHKVFDQNKFNDKLIEACVVVPNLNNEDLQKHYGTYGDPAGTLEAMLLAGEYNILAKEIMDLSGLNEDSDIDLVEEAKN